MKEKKAKDLRVILGGAAEPGKYAVLMHMHELHVPFLKKNSIL